MRKNFNKILWGAKLKIQTNYKVILLNLFSLAGIILLGVNIFRVLGIGVQRYRFISEEQEVLIVLRDDEQYLSDDLDWYSSLDFIEMQSRDYLNLALEGDSILIIPEVGEDVLSGKVANEKSLVQLEPSIGLWVKLLF